MGLQQTIEGLPALGRALTTESLLEFLVEGVNYRVTYGQLRSNILGYSNSNQVCGLVNGELVPISNMAEAPDDGKAYIRKGRAWVPSAMESPTDTAHQLMRRGDQWERMDRQDLKILDPTGLAGFDLNIAQVFRMDGTLDHAIVFKNLPSDERAIEIDLHFTGSGGLITWPSGVIWHQNTTPTLGNLYTHIRLTWLGTFMAGFVLAKA
jgi:hypothetical protein